MTMTFSTAAHALYGAARAVRALHANSDSLKNLQECADTFAQVAGLDPELAGDEGERGDGLGSCMHSPCACHPQEEEVITCDVCETPLDPSDPLIIDDDKLVKCPACFVKADEDERADDEPEEERFITPWEAFSRRVDAATSSAELIALDAERRQAFKSDVFSAGEARVLFDSIGRRLHEFRVREVQDSLRAQGGA